MLLLNTEKSLKFSKGDKVIIDFEQRFPLYKLRGFKEFGIVDDVDKKSEFRGKYRVKFDTNRGRRYLWFHENELKFNTQYLRNKKLKLLLSK